MAGIAVVVIFLALLARGQTTFDLSADFSLHDNPNKVWQYGYSATNSFAPDQFRFDKHADITGPVGFWHPDASSGPGPGYYPYIAYNTTKQSQAWPSPNGWVVRGGEVAMEARNSGQYRLGRFVAPAAGSSKISAQFAGVHVLCTTDVHVLRKCPSLFYAAID